MFRLWSRFPDRIQISQCAAQRTQRADVVGQRTIRKFFRSIAKIFLHNVACLVCKKAWASAGESQHHIPFRQNNHILPQHPVELIGAFCPKTPNLVTIAGGIIPFPGGGIHLGRFGNPAFWQKLLFSTIHCPTAALQIELSQFCHIHNPQPESPTTFFNSQGAYVPTYMVNPQWIEQARRQIFHQSHARLPVKNGTEQVRIQTVITEFRSWLKGTVRL